MAGIELRVIRRGFLPGCSAGLSEPTALVELSPLGVIGPGDLTEERFATAAAALPPGVSPRVGPADWPRAFLVDGDARTADIPHRLGQWVVALTVAIQRWGGDPVWRGRVRGVEGDTLLLAIPWFGQWWFDEALSVALRLIRQWSAPDPQVRQWSAPDPQVRQWSAPEPQAGRPATLDQVLDGRLAQIRAGGLDAGALLLLEAAARRGMPAAVRPGFLQIGWGSRAQRFARRPAALAAPDPATVRALAEAGLPTAAAGRQPDHRLLVVCGTVLQVGRSRNGNREEDVTGTAHRDNLALAARAARTIGADLAEVRLCCPDISRSWRDVGAVICDVNAHSAVDEHLADPARDLHGAVLDTVFAGGSARIPTAAITGTNGKTTTAEMLSRIWTHAGALTGVCTTERVRIGSQIVSTKNLSGQPGARIILDDPAVGAAVFEMPRKGLIYFGHPCDRYDVAALLNVADDHLGRDGIDTLEQMADLKSEVLQRATSAVVVNAEDPLCLAALARAGTSRHILVARNPLARPVVEHRRRGGEAVFLDTRDGGAWIVLAGGGADVPLMPVRDIPATMNGLLAVNATNAMFAAALAWAQGVEPAVIRRALGSFRNTAEENPGRFNVIDGLPFEILLDFAHNPDGVRGLCAVATGLPVSGRRLLCTLSIGTRHPEHFDAVAPLLADCFEEIVIGCDPAEVRESPEFAAALDPDATMLARARSLLLRQGVSPDRITCEADPLAAIRAAFDRARPGDLVVLLAELHEAIPVVNEWLAAGKGRPGGIRNG